jgi:hypothetical protein
VAKKAAAYAIFELGQKSDVNLDLKMLRVEKIWFIKISKKKC